MTTTVDEHYTGGGLLERVLAAVSAAGLDPDHLDAADLGGFDDFHTGGRGTTERLAGLAGVEGGERVLDLGCGLGGPARYLASRGCTVVGVDLTPEFVAVGQELTRRCKLDDKVDLRVGDATATGLDAGSFDLVWTQHVSMNIADKAAFYGEARRVLRPGGRLAFFDVVGGDGSPLELPVPWASVPEISHLLPADDLRPVVESAGFTVTTWDDATDQIVPGFRGMLDSLLGGGGPALSLLLYMPNAETAMRNYLANLDAGRTRVLFGVAEAS
jgi:SAM-dependent methyltransferase